MKRRIWLIAILVAALAVIVGLVLASREPSFEGKTLPQWAIQFHTNGWPLDKKAEAAIKHFGTNGIPVLLTMLKREESPRRIWLGDHMPKSLLAMLHISEGGAYKAEVLQSRGAGAAGFIALGEDARLAVPGLIVLLHHKDWRIRYWAIFALRTMGPVAKDALPEVVLLLKDPSRDIRDDAIMTLGSMRADPEHTVPLIMDFLAKNRTDETLCEDSLQALGSFGPDAKQAIPIILPHLNDSRPVVSERASNALMRIDPGSLSATNQPPSK